MLLCSSVSAVIYAEINRRDITFRLSYCVLVSFYCAWLLQIIRISCENKLDELSLLVNKLLLLSIDSNSAIEKAINNFSNGSLISS